MQFQNSNLIFVTDTQTDGQAQSYMPTRLLLSLGHKSNVPCPTTKVPPF